MLSFSLFEQKGEQKSEKTPSQESWTSAQIMQKIDSLYRLSPQDYCQRFTDASSAYLSQKKAVFKTKKGFVGPGLISFDIRPYVATLLSRTHEQQVRPSQKELVEFLNENGVGKNKKSLKFHVLVKMFDLNPLAYSDTTAAKLIDDIHHALLFRLQAERQGNPSANTEPELIYHPEKPRMYALNL